MNIMLLHLSPFLTLSIACIKIYSFYYFKSSLKMKSTSIKCPSISNISEFKSVLGAFVKLSHIYLKVPEERRNALMASPKPSVDLRSCFAAI